MNQLMVLLRIAENVDKMEGWVITIFGFLIVVVALFSLSYIFRGTGALFLRGELKKTEPKTNTPKNEPTIDVANGEITNEELTAIGMALFLSTEIHDEESNVITIKKSGNSPWNSKIYGINNLQK